jgi:hypothetical protein
MSWLPFEPDHATYTFEADWVIINPVLTRSVDTCIFRGSNMDAMENTPIPWDWRVIKTAIGIVTISMARGFLVLAMVNY